jgi:hypothetical protein
MTTTYTRSQAMTALGLKPTSRSAFHYLRRKYPQAFVVVNQGTDRSNPSLYDKDSLDKFIEWRNAYPKKGPQS